MFISKRHFPRELLVFAVFPAVLGLLSLRALRSFQLLHDRFLLVLVLLPRRRWCLFAVLGVAMSFSGFVIVSSAGSYPLAV